MKQMMFLVVFCWLVMLGLFFLPATPAQSQGFNIPDFECPAYQPIMTGFKNGKPVCSSFNVWSSDDSKLEGQANGSGGWIVLTLSNKKGQ